MDLTGYADRPPAKMGSSLADIISGLYAVNGILLALLARQKSGQGQVVDISLLDSLVSTLTYQAMIYFSTGQSPQRMGTRHPSIVPYECFQAKDGFINIGVANEKQWASLCQSLGIAALASDPRFGTMAARIANYDELRPILSGVLSEMSRADIMRVLEEGGIAVGSVNTVAEALENPQIRAREMVVELTHPEYGLLKMLGLPIKLSDTPGELRTAPPRYGEHSRVVLRELGFNEATIYQLMQAKVIAEPHSYEVSLAKG